MNTWPVVEFMNFVGCFSYSAEAVMFTGRHFIHNCFGVASSTLVSTARDFMWWGAEKENDLLVRLVSVVIAGVSSECQIGD